MRSGRRIRTPGDNTIDFDSTVFNAALTINLTGGQLELGDANCTETIVGPAAGVTVSGGGQSRVFQVDAGVTASFSGLTITGGSTDGSGGGLANDGTRHADRLHHHRQLRRGERRRLVPVPRHDGALLLHRSAAIPPR